MPDPTNVSAVSTRVEAEDDSLDALVSKASKPTLASLFQQGKDAGLIKPVVEYASTTA